MARGTIKIWNEDRGFGFASVEGQPDVFLHVSYIEARDYEPRPGEMVEFDIVQDQRKGKPRANRIRRV